LILENFNQSWVLVDLILVGMDKDSNLKNHSLFSDNGGGAPKTTLARPRREARLAYSPLLGRDVIKFRAHVCLLAPTRSGTKIKIVFCDQLAANAALSADLGFYGRRGRTTYEQNGPTDHIPIFLNHFISKPSENATILRALFVDKNWSAGQIAQFTGWSKTAVIDALQLHEITRAPKTAALRPRYGWKIEDGELIPHVRQQAVIARMKKWREAGASFHQIAKNLNEGNIPTLFGKKWEHKAVHQILNREANSKSGKAES
jgi:Recombinase